MHRRHNYRSIQIHELLNKITVHYFTKKSLQENLKAFFHNSNYLFIHFQHSFHPKKQRLHFDLQKGRNLQACVIFWFLYTFQTF
jgi:hypothetical protein